MFKAVLCCLLSAQCLHVGLVLYGVVWIENRKIKMALIINRQDYEKKARVIWSSTGDISLTTAALYDSWLTKGEEDYKQGVSKNRQE